MNEVIADTSVWIDFLNGINNKQTLSLSEILQNDTDLFAPKSFRKFYRAFQRMTITGY